MAQTKESIKVIEAALAIGFKLSEAVQRALGAPLAEFASRHGFTPQAVTMCLGAYQGRVYSDIRDALCADLEIPREYIDRLLSSQAQAAAESEPAA
jgi:hypothetical protein